MKLLNYDRKRKGWSKSVFPALYLWVSVKRTYHKAVEATNQSWCPEILIQPACGVGVEQVISRRCGCYVCESVQEQIGQVLAKTWALKLKAWLNQPIIRQYKYKNKGKFYFANLTDRGPIVYVPGAILVPLTVQSAAWWKKVGKHEPSILHGGMKQGRSWQCGWVRRGVRRIVNVYLSWSAVIHLRSRQNSEQFSPRSSLSNPAEIKIAFLANYERRVSWMCVRTSR